MGLKRSTNSIPSSKICKTTAKLSSWTSTRWHTKWVPHKWRSILPMRIYVIVNKIWKTNRNFSKNVDFYINQKQNSATWSIRISTVSVNGCNLAQIEAKFDRSRNLILKFLHKNEEHRQAYLAVLHERDFYHAKMIERLVMLPESLSIDASGLPVVFIRTCYLRIRLWLSIPLRRGQILWFRLGRYLSVTKNKLQRRSLKQFFPVSRNLIYLHSFHLDFAPLPPCLALNRRCIDARPNFISWSISRILL